MMPRSVARLTRMDRAELAWRAGAATRTAIDRVRTRWIEPCWSREDLVRALAATEDLGDVRRALSAHAWDDAHRALARRLASAAQGFAIAPSARTAVVARIRDEFPQAAAHAVISFAGHRPRGDG